MTAPDNLIQIEHLTKVFYTDEIETHALSGVHLNIARGEYVAMSGPSGCGKSTLLSIIGLLDTPTDGRYTLNSKEVAQPGDRLHLSELQPDRRPHRLRECRVAAHLSLRHASG